MEVKLASQRLHQQLREENTKLLEQNRKLRQDNEKLLKTLEASRSLTLISIEPNESANSEDQVFNCIIGKKVVTPMIKFEIHTGNDEFDFVPLSIDEEAKVKLPECLQSESTADNEIMPSFFGQLLCSIQKWINVDIKIV